MDKPLIKKPFVGDFPITMDFGAAPSWYVQIAGYPHNGIDFGMPVGSEIVACADGVIVYADNVPDADGIGININHEWGMSQYWHLSSLVKGYRDGVKKGELIGRSGATGWATGPHLHFGVKVNGEGDEGMKGWSNPGRYWETPVPAPSVPFIVPRTYIVLPGDNLWKIAEKFYNKGYYWTKIYEANKDRIKNPTLIWPFQRLLIP
jgi:murein DD-endopeptidase MepM/ murein hydrolase activator NlpD